MSVDTLPPSDTCNAQDRANNNTPCNRRSGFKTQHPGYGRCWKHDQNPELVLPAPTALRKLVDKRKNDKNIYDLSSEVAVSKAVTEYLMAKISEEEDNDMANKLTKTLSTFLNTTGNLVDKMDKLEASRKYVIHIDEVKKILDTLINIILEEVDDSVIQEKVLDRLLNVQVEGAVTVPPDDWKYADEWALHNSESKETKVPGEDQIIDIIEKMPSETQETEQPEKLSLKDFPARLRTVPPGKQI